MFTDWLTISYGKLDPRLIEAWMTNARLLQAKHPACFTMRTFGNYSICLPGQYWQALGEDESAGHRQVVACLRWAEGAHVSRFDLAHDLNEKDGLRARAIVLLREDITVLDGPGGWTVYIGNRESDRFARLYNKRQEIQARTGVDIGFNLIRFEFEAKGSYAREYYHLWQLDRGVVQADVLARYDLNTIVQGYGTDLLRFLCLSGPDPFAFALKFGKAIRKAYDSDPVRFDAEILHVDRDTALPPSSG